ncbi:hypothetical protein ASZ78_004698 [Callipepla squamata]|uniref:Mitotic arrest deficient 1 like 1 n=1 Tax=Callipepla squamata TaxID=9009 RepID=A0A226NJG1_CALSU|nr:hypothetical protein ASZ78_004698 [Callipepla squamata]
MLEKARQQLQEEILQIQSQLLDEKKKREQHEALVRRLQKRVLLLTKVLQSAWMGKTFTVEIEKELHLSSSCPSMLLWFGSGLAGCDTVVSDAWQGVGYSPVCVYGGHGLPLEMWAVLERDGMRAILESYDSELTPAEHSPQLNRRMREAEEMVQKLHAHNAELEVQMSQVLEEVGSQKQRAEMLEVEMKALKSRECAAEQSTFITKEEVDTLRLKIEELEAERGKLEEQNRSLEMKLEKLTMQGDYDPSKTKVLHFSMNPASLAKQQRKEEQQQLQEECERLRELVRVLEAGGSIHGNLEGVGSFQSPQEVAELKKQVESAELKNQRLKEIFQTKIQEFRKVCYTLTGYQIDITTENQYRLTSIYAEHQGDCLLFKCNGDSAPANVTRLYSG